MEGCRKAVAERILRDMLGSIKDSTGGGWKVLVMDEFTTRVMSSTLKMSDIQDCNVSVVENLSLARQPMPLVGVYFIQPNPNSIAELLRDFEGAKPLYPSVHIFFSSKIPSSAMTKIKGCPALLNVVKTMKESNIEFLTVDSHSFVTDNPYAPALLLGDQADIVQQNEAERELNIIATRLGTALATLNVYPVVRYRKGKAPEAGDAPGAQARATLTQRLATKLIDRVDAMQLPNNNECDVLILDRTYDPVAPFIHEWTYETLVYDLLKVEGNIFKYPGEPGPLGLRTEEKEAILEETDSVWCELRHTFIADVYTTLAARFKEFSSKNKAAKLGGGGIKDKGDMSASSIRQLITALPQFREVLSRLSLHIQISSDLQTVTNQRILADVGELEQDLVLGEKNSKDMVEFLTENQQRMTPKDKVRLIMCYCATHPEKLDPTKLAAWSKAAKLSQHDMMMVTNLALLGCAVMKQPEKLEKASGSFFGGKKGKERPELLRRKKADDGGYALFRFEPLLKDVLCDLAANKLPVDQFPFVRAPGPDVASGPSASAQSVRTGGGGRQGMTWTKRDPEPGVGGATGRRLIVFIIGGAVRSEMRVAHELSKTLKREVILGSTSMETPTSFLDHLARMNTQGTMYGV